MNTGYILVAEDDADDRFLLQTAFTERGFNDKLVFVDNGIEVLSHLLAFEKQPHTTFQFPAFILLDLNMPKKNGRETLEEIKKHHRLKRIPVVIYTTTKSESEIKLCYELGANSYIVKPARFDSLLQVVDSMRKYWYTVVSLPG